jgi:hypothetical protein
MNWPSSLQQYLNGGDFGLEFVDPTIKSQNDVGPVKTRRRYTGVRKIYSGSINLHKDDYATLENFFFVSTNGGVLPFEITDPITSLPVTVRFADPPALRRLGGVYFVVSLRFETL